ncbi:hypothetical protein L2755_22015 [Shewanella abyssi]|nr:hypothetical protein [Shewanella abyssi]MCL1052253.1 hypothetical protein [Shewanella abyssi]
MRNETLLKRVDRIDNLVNVTGITTFIANTIGMITVLDMPMLKLGISSV